MNQPRSNGAPLIRVAAVMLVAYAAMNVTLGWSSGLYHGFVAMLGLGLFVLSFWMPEQKEEERPTVESETEEDAMAIVRALAPAIDTGDPLARGRAKRIAHFCRRVGEELVLDSQQLRDLECAALLHDIGRTVAHTDVRLLKRKLRPEEKETLETLPETSYRLIRSLPGLRGAAEIVYAHHEQPDGRGYPRNLKPGDIPFGSRILMAVVAFDAMTSDRPYRRGLSPDEAYAELRKCAGTMFFADVVGTLISLHESGRLFDGFDPDELALYAKGQLSSRAFESYVRDHPEITAGASSTREADSDDDLLDLGLGDTDEHAA